MVHLKQLQQKSIDQVIAPGEIHSLKVDEIIAEGTTNGQTYEIVRLTNYGLGLFIAGRLQSAQLDEHIYHESLLWPGALLLKNVRDVLSFGGANGGVVRELLKIPTIESITVLDVDEALFQVCRHLLPHMHPSRFPDDRVEYIFGDPLAIFQKMCRSFDMVVADLPDATEHNYAFPLFEQSFYHSLRRVIRPNGLFVTQAGQAHPLACEFFNRTLHTMRREFAHVTPYTAAIPSFGIPWGFIIGSYTLDASRWNCHFLQARLNALPFSGLRNYDIETHAHMFNLPKALRLALGKIE